MVRRCTTLRNVDNTMLVLVMGKREGGGERGGGKGR
jgi:hypothetical protein